MVGAEGEPGGAIMRSRIACTLPLVVVLMVGCDDSSPTQPIPSSAEVEFVYFSSVTAGDADPAEAGGCYHHLLGSSWLNLWVRGERVDSIQLRPDGGAVWRGREELPVGVELAVVIVDFECCSHDDPCEPTERVLANGVPLDRIVEVLDAAGSYPGLAFRVLGDGRVVP